MELESFSMIATTLVILDITNAGNLGIDCLQQLHNNPVGAD